MANGFEWVSTKASHVKLRKVTIYGKKTVIVPDHSELADGTLRAIIRQSGLDRSAFEA